VVDEDIISADEVISAEDGMAEEVLSIDDVSIAALVIMADDISAEDGMATEDSITVPGA